MRKELRSLLGQAEKMGRAGEPCPFVPGVTPGMEKTERAPLIGAFLRKNFPAGEYGAESVAALTELLEELTRRWQAGTREEATEWR